jgi:hypothetical protein
VTEPAVQAAPSPDSGDGAPQRLYFHVGLPKSGSTYLQSVLGGNRGALKAAGYAYPYVRQEGMFHAAVEMAGSAARWGLDPDEIRGTFAHLLRRGRRLGGTVVLSHEIFGAASRDQVRAMADELAGFEVHLVVTARDLGRTVTAGWQEQVKNGNPRSFQDFADELLAHLPADPADSRDFWPAQNLYRLLDRWELMVPPERMHVVTCPRSGAAPDLLWRRFAEAIGLPHDAVDLSEVPTRNESLGTAQIALLRNVLTSLDGRLEQPWFSRIAKRWFAQTLLSQVPSRKPKAPGPVVERLSAVSSAWVAGIRAGSYQVHGDLDELLPETVDSDLRHPDDVTAAEMLEGLPDVVADMLLRTRDLRVELAELDDRNRELVAERDRLEGRLVELSAAHEARGRWRRRLLPRRAATTR